MTTNLIWSATRRLLSLSFLAFPLVSLAGNQTTSTKRPQVVVMTAMEMGDVACYLTFRNEAWEEKTALASHDICSQVTLLYQNQKSHFVRLQSWVIAAKVIRSAPILRRSGWLIAQNDTRSLYVEIVRCSSMVVPTNKGEIIAFCTEPKSQECWMSGPTI